MDDNVKNSASNSRRAKNKMESAEESKPKRTKREEVDALGQSAMENDQSNKTATVHDLPDFIFLKILQYFPLEEQVRLSRVDKSFRRISQISISQTKSLTFRRDVADRLSSMAPSSLESILALCAGNLVSVRVAGFDNDQTFPIFDKFAEYSFPHLTTLHINGARIGERVLSRLIEKNPNLEDILFPIGSDQRVAFPSGVYPKLKRVEFQWCDDGLLRSMIGKVPKLRKFCVFHDLPICASTWNDFFGCVPKLEKLAVPQLDFHRVTNFWSLSSLIKLQVFDVDGPDTAPIDDDVVKKISDRFPQLRSFEAYCRVTITAAGFGALAGLNELRELSIDDIVFPDNDASDALEKLSACGGLESIDIDCNASTAALISLIHFCPNLHSATFRKISDTKEAILAMLDSLLEIGQRKRISIDFSQCPMLWRLDFVKAKLEKLRGNGIDFGMPGAHDPADYSDAEFDFDLGEWVDPVSDSDEN